MGDLFNKILTIINNLKDDEDKLQAVLDFLENHIIEEDDYNPIDELPEKYKPLINEIAQYIDMGMLCYLNPKTAELDFLPQEMFYDVDSIDDVDEVKQRLDDLHGWETVKFLDWEKSIEFEPFPSFESFKIMESFAHRLSDDEKIRPRLINALRNRKPFANFSRIIDNSLLRDDWFAYKQEWIEKEVARQLLVELENLKENNNEI